MSTEGSTANDAHPTSNYRKMRELMRNFPRDTSSLWMPLGDGMHYDHQRHMADDPTAAQAMLQYQQEDGRIRMPPEIEDSLIKQGYIIFVK